MQQNKHIIRKEDVMHVNRIQEIALTEKVYECSTENVFCHLTNRGYYKFYYILFIFKSRIYWYCLMLSSAHATPLSAHPKLYKENKKTFSAYSNRA